MQTLVAVGSIDRPSIFKSRLFPVIAVAAISGWAWLAYNLYYAEFMKNRALWTFGTLVVFWFAVSGGMHNIIRCPLRSCNGMDIALLACSLLQGMVCAVAQRLHKEQ